MKDDLSGQRIADAQAAPDVGADAAARADISPQEFSLLEAKWQRDFSATVERVKRLAFDAENVKSAEEYSANIRRMDSAMDWMGSAEIDFSSGIQCDALACAAYALVTGYDGHFDKESAAADTLGAPIFFAVQATTFAAAKWVKERFG